MASLLKQHGRYSLQFYDAARTPAKKRVALHTDQKRTADALRRKLEHDHALGRFDPWRDDPFAYDRPAPPAPAPRSLAEATADFLRYLDEHGRQPTTIRTYRTLLRVFARAVGEDVPLGAVTTAHVRAYVWCRSVAPATRYTHYRHVKAFFAHAARLAPEPLPNPAEGVEPPPNRERLPKVVMEADLDAVCAAVEHEYARKRASGRCRVGEVVWVVPLFRFAFLSGLRASELARLRWGHVDLEAGALVLLQQKSGREQVLPVGRRALGVLRNLPAGAPEAYVFAAPGHAAGERSVQAFVWNVSAAFRRAKTAAGIEGPGCFHGLRHGFCTALAQAGMNAAVIQRAARHATVYTTMRYVHLADEALRQSLDAAFPDAG